MSRPRVIAICGFKRSGKDTVAEHLARSYGYAHHKIAAPLKQAMRVLFGFTVEELETDVKDVIHPSWGVRPRELMTFLGTQVFQHELSEVIPGLGREFWIRRFWHAHGASGSPVVISDLRFQHEYDFLSRQLQPHELLVVRVERGEPAIQGHVSEMEHLQLPVHAILHNHTSIESLVLQVDAMASQLNSGQSSIDHATAS